MSKTCKCVKLKCWTDLNTTAHTNSINYYQTKSHFRFLLEKTATVMVTLNFHSLNMITPPKIKPPPNQFQFNTLGPACLFAPRITIRQAHSKNRFIQSSLWQQQNIWRGNDSWAQTEFPQSCTASLLPNSSSCLK